eukprot:3901754-Rhodomonas_salina.1
MGRHACDQGFHGHTDTNKGANRDVWGGRGGPIPEHGTGRNGLGRRRKYTSTGDPAQIKTGQAVCGAGPVADSTQTARNHHSSGRAPGTDNPGGRKTDGNRRGG